MGYIETVLCSKGKVILLKEHLDRLSWSLYQNGVTAVNEVVLRVQETILDQVQQDEKYYKIRVLININENSFDINTELTPIDKPRMELYKIGWYDEELKTIELPWNAKSSQRRFYQQAGNWAGNHGFDDVIVLNEKGHVVETTIFNVFVLKDNVLYTPPLYDMPVKGVMRTWLFRNSYFPVIEQVLLKEDVVNSDMILLTNAIRGIQIGIL